MKVPRDWAWRTQLRRCPFCPRCANVRQILECGGGIDTELITFEGTLHSEPLDP